MTQPGAQLDEREQLLRRLQASHDNYLFVVKALAEEAASFRVSPESWSILECAEHVAVAERQMLALWTKLAQPGKANAALDMTIQEAITDRSRRQVAPERARPSGRYESLAEAIRHFSAHREETIAYLQNSDEDLRGKVVTHPLFGILDGFQLMLVMAGHPERHAAQIEEMERLRQSAIR